MGIYPKKELDALDRRIRFDRIESLPDGGTLSASGFYDNIGASALVAFILAATPGITVQIKRTESFEITLAPASGQQIFWTGTPGGMTADEKLRFTADGDTLHAVVDNNGDVQVTSETGSIVEETP